jgi:hypothetical protein
MAYSPPSNDIQRFALRIHERTVEVIVELLARTSQLGFCLHTLLDSEMHPSRTACGGAYVSRVRLSSGGDRP